jgi:L-aminopeptidase/D-esterase-like protein
MSVCPPRRTTSNSGQRCPELSEADIAEAFTIPTEEPDAGAIWTEIGMLAAQCVARAVARGVYEATTLDVPAAQPSWRRLYGA